MIRAGFFFIILSGLSFCEANQILSYLDSTVNPCDDFYKFACGGFIDSAEIDNDKAENSSFSQVDSKVDEQLKVIVSEPPTKDEPPPFRSLKHLFSLCMDEKKLDARGVGPALNIIKGAGGWPVLGNWKRKNWNILDTYIRLRKFMVGEDSLFQIYVEVDMKNNSRRIIQVDQASLGLPQELFVEGPSNAMVKEYFSLMVDVAVMLGADRKTAMKQLRSSLYFEIELAKIMTVKEKRRDFNRMYNLYKLSDMTAELGWNWGSLFQRILPESMSLKRDELINVVEVEYLKKLKRLMQSHPKEVIANYMMWHAVRNMMTLLTTEMRNRHQNFLNLLMGTNKRQPRWKECLDRVRRLSTVLSSLYVRKFFDKTSKRLASGIVEKIRQETSMLIKEVDWMDQQTRKQAEYKVSKIAQYIGYPDELLDNRKIEELYDGLVLNKNCFFEASFDMARWYDQYNFRKLREAVNQSDWKTHSQVATANAWYSPIENSIMFPAGILQSPFFNAKVPMYVNFAKIGAVVGHEIIHGFDDKGSQFDFRGNLRNWWNRESRDKFNKKKQCMINQYNAFKETQTQLYLNGVNTQGENIADSAGLKLAYRAYKRLKRMEAGLPNLEQYNNDQLFMLSAATLWCSRTRLEMLKLSIMLDTHSPKEFRVKGSFANMPAFGKIFQCELGTPMNPHKKCSVW
ncbi:neprilysin-2-like isoform X2 [Homalodisca vitripennis]|uniref:neprilysin-2-like isoform X2 n=1 Tax=Homalodisca vitripennis TaxID=197043 RepID=UPI001EEA04BC|nr:neprilysin-2-like isoform X2 [Homalodisca vitripennis]